MIDENDFEIPIARLLHVVRTLIWWRIMYLIFILGEFSIAVNDLQLLRIIPGGEAWLLAMFAYGGGGVKECYEGLVKSVQSALSDLLTTSATHGTFSRPSTKRWLILIGLKLNTNARESFEHCWWYSWHVHCEFFLSRPFPGSLSVI